MHSPTHCTIFIGSRVALYTALSPFTYHVTLRTTSYILVSPVAWNRGASRIKGASLPVRRPRGPDHSGGRRDAESPQNVSSGRCIIVSVSPYRPNYRSACTRGASRRSAAKVYQTLSKGLIVARARGAPNRPTCRREQIEAPSPSLPLSTYRFQGRPSLLSEERSNYPRRHQNKV